MSRKQRLALAYCVSFLVNGLFWLAYGRELRRAGAAPPRPQDTTAALKPVVLGRYVPLPPAAKREPKPADTPSPVSGTQTADKAGGASQSTRAGGRQASAGAAGSTSGAQGAAGIAGGAQGQSQSAQAGQGAAARLAQGQTSGGGAAHNGSSGAEKSGTSASGKSGASGAANHSQSGAGASAAQLAGQKTAGAGTSGKKLAQGQKPSGKTRNAPTLKETASLAAEQKDNKEGSDTKTAEKKAEQDEPAKKPKPTSAVSLKIVKMWTPKPGQKFNLASSLNISLPKNLQLVPGPPLTSDQIEQLKKLLQQQKLRHVGLDRKQLKKLLEARRTTESKRPPEKNKPGDDARKREREREARKPKPRTLRPPSNKTPKLASASMQRPRSPFTYKQWNSDMFKRWAPRQDVADTGTTQNSLGTGSASQNPQNAKGTGSAAQPGGQRANAAGAGGPAAQGTRIASNQGVPAAGGPLGGSANGGDAGQNNGSPAGAPGTGTEPDKGANGGGVLGGGAAGANNPTPAPQNGGGQPGGANQPGGQNAPGNNGGGLLGGTPGAANAGGSPAPGGAANGGGAPAPGGNPAPGNAGNNGGANQNQGGGLLGGGNAGTPAGQPGSNQNVGAPGGANPPGGNQANPGGGLLGGGAPAGSPGGAPPAGGNAGQGNPNQGTPGGGVLGGGAPAGNPGGANAPAGNPGGANAPAGNAGGNPPANQGNAGGGLLGGGAAAGNPGGAPPPGGSQGQGGNPANAGGGNAPGGKQNQGNAGGGLLGGGAPAGNPGGGAPAGGGQGQGNNQANAGGGLLGGGAPAENQGGNPPPNGGNQNANGPAPGGMLGGGGAPAGGGNQPPGGGNQANGGMLGGGGAPAGSQGNQGQATAGQAGGAPGGMLGGGGQAGNPPQGQNPGGAPGQVGDANQGQQTADAGAGMTGDGSGAGGSEGAMFLGGEQGDGMDAGENEAQANTEDTGFSPAVSSAPDLPAENPSAKKGIPGSLVLPPSPPMGTENGKLPTPRRVKKTLIQMATEGAPAAQGHQATRPLPSSAPRAPQKMAKTPVGMPTKPRRRAVRLALTVGSTSLNGTLPFTVMDRPHLPIGAVSDAVDPPLPPAKGIEKSQLVAPKSEPSRSEKATRSAQPNRAGKPVAAKQASPPIVRTAKNSQGIKNGTEQPLPPTPLPDSDMEVGDGSGLKGEYYLGRKFDQYQFTRADPMVDFDWKAGESPSPRIPSGSDYTIRWTGKIQPKYSETYTFYATVDDGVRIWINHKLIIDDWTLHAATQFSNTIPLQAGEQYLFKVEYLESAGGAATVQLYWESPSQPKEFIPENAFFYPLPGDEEDMKRDKAPL